MDVLPKSARFRALAILALAGLPPGLCAQTATVQKIALVNSPQGVEVEITCSAPINPQVQLIENPERLVIDFPQAVPGGSLRNLRVHRAEVKNVRVGLFAEHPPVTRLVLDLTGPQRYEVLPAANRILIKVGEAEPQQTARVTPVNFVPAAVPVPPVPQPAPRVMVRFQNGLLSIRADKASLAEVLSEVQRRTGADIPIPGGADQELVAANIGPMPADAALASLFNGSRFNFILVSSADNPAALRSVILTPKNGLPPGQVISAVSPAAGRAMAPPSPPAASDEDDSEDADEPQDQPQPPPAAEDQAQPH